MNILITFIIISIISDFIFSTFRVIRHRKEIDAAYKRGLSDARQASSEVINEIKIKISEGKSFHESAADVANELSERLKDINTM